MTPLESFDIFIAQYLFVIAPLLFGVYVLISLKTSKKAIIHLFTASIVVLLLALIASHLYFNPRPFVVAHTSPLIPHAPDNGFPSDHVLLTATISAVLFIYNRKLGIASWIVTLLVGYARIAIGIHHTIDVLGSIVIALIGTGVVYGVLGLLSKKAKISF